MTSATPTPWTVRCVPDSAAAGCDLVRQLLREFNWQTNPDFMQRIHEPEHQPVPLVLLAESDSALAESGSAVIGGLFAETQLAWLRISLMAVDPAYRSRGIGGALLAEAERQAVARGCLHAFVDTMDYQAPGFYLARGFHIAGQIPDWDSHGHRKVYMIKQLTVDEGSEGARRSDSIERSP